MSRLDKLLEAKEEKNISVPLQIRLPISDYLDIGEGSFINARAYAKRDKKGIIKKTERVVLKLMKAKRLPYNVEIVPEFRFIKDGKAWWSVTVSGGEKGFLSRLKKLNIRTLE